MELRVLNTAGFRTRVDERVGDLSADAVLADLLRSEISARASCVRAAAVSRVLRATDDRSSDDELRLRLGELCRALESDGDFSVSRGGVLHVSPVRAVVLDPTCHRIVASLPTRRLRPRLPGTLDVTGTRRTLQFSSTQEDAVRRAIQSLGGVVITVAEWAGLERSPKANDAWLRSLEQRLIWHSEAAGSLERDGVLDWATLELTGEGPRWRRRSEAPTQLWRTRSPHGRWLWAWTAPGHTPTNGSFVSLFDDDAARTVFALARGDEPVQARLDRPGDEVRLTLREWLPRAEYRFLSALGSCSFLNREAVWSFPEARGSHVLETLEGRLGVQIVETECAE